MQVVLQIFFHLFIYGRPDGNFDGGSEQYPRR